MDRPDIPRLIGDILQEAKIVAVDAAARTVRVKIGDLESGELPWLAGRAGGCTIWATPIVGESVLVAAPEGDLARAIVVGSLFNGDHQPGNSDPNVVQIDFDDGASLSYDKPTHALHVALPGGGKVTLDAPGGVTVNGPLHVEGDVSSSGTVTADTDVVGAGKSLKGHKHIGVAAGSAVSGAPQ